jgi:CheY-like chemotaxis protein
VSQISVCGSPQRMLAAESPKLVRRLRDHPLRSNIPAIALTGFYESYLDTAGFTAFLRKPVDLDKLCKAIIDASEAGHPRRRAE